MARKALVTCVLLIGCGVGGCGGGRRSPAPAVQRLVPGPPSAYTAIRVVTGERTAPVPGALAAEVAPLLVARVFTPTESPASYGLVAPVAHVVYVARGGGRIDVALGAATFDRHFLYARRTGQAAIALVAASVADQLLALIGVSQAPPP